MEISVVIPTHKRPELLRSTLRSVAEQSEIGLIREVIVSENSDSSASLAVCAEFANLPIRHIQQTPPLEVLPHFCRLVTEAQSGWVAWLADDDMWSRTFLTNGVSALQTHPECVAYLANCAPVRNETRRITRGYTPTLESIWGMSAETGSLSVWSCEKMFVECLTRTPFSLWGLLCDARVLRKSVHAWTSQTGQLDSDRWFLCYLATCGKIVVDREVGIFARDHAETATARLWENIGRDAFVTTQNILSLASDVGLQLEPAWTAVWQGLSSTQRQEFLASSLPESVSVLEKAWNHSILAPRVPIFMKNVCRDVVPPLIWRILARVKARLKT